MGPRSPDRDAGPCPSPVVSGLLSMWPSRQDRYAFCVSSQVTCWFPAAATRKCSKLGGFKITETYSLRVGEARGWNQGAGRTVLPPGAPEDNSGGFKWSLAVAASPQTRPRMALSSVSQTSPSLSLIRTPSLDLRPTWMIPDYLSSGSLPKLYVQRPCF